MMRAPIFFTVHFLLLLRVSGRGTDPGLKEVFLGRCAWKHMEKDQSADASEYCIQLFNLFNGSWAGRSPTAVPAAAFDAFGAAANFSAPRDRALFWSGTYSIVHEFSDGENTRRFVTLEDTWGGYTLDGLTWCGSASSVGGWNRTGCPAFHLNPAMNLFWAEASKAFAAAATGKATALVRGEPGRDAFRDDSYFATQEVPNLSKDKVSEFDILVVTNKEAPAEKCGSGSLVRMVAALEAQLGSGKVACIDDPDSVHHITCIDAPPEDRACQFVKGSPGGGGRDKPSSSCSRTGDVVAVLLGAVLLTAGVFKLLWGCDSRGGVQRRAGGGAGGARARELASALIDEEEGDEL